MDIHVVGGINTDISGISFGAVQPGVSVPGRVIRSVGGAGRNVAANLARLGMQVALYSRVAADADGNDAREATASAGVNVEHIDTGAPRSDAYVALLDKSGELSAAVADMAAVESIDIAQVESWFPSLLQCRVAIVDTNLQSNVLNLLVERFAAAGIYCIIQASSAEKVARIAALSQQADLVVCNREEAAALSTAAGYAPSAVWSAASGFAEALCITAGAERLTLYGPDGTQHFQPFTVPSVVDTTGAGDALTAGIALGRFRGESLDRSVRYGLAAAATALHSEGADAPELTLDRLRAMLDELDGPAGV